MQQININELKPHPRNNEFFDDITGSNWEQFIESMRERIRKGKSGNIEPIVITPNKIIISGHQRVRGLKELGVKYVNAEIKIYESEDEILADLIETNIRQRGIGNPNAVKLGRCIKELERIYGIREGSFNEKGNNRIGDTNNFNDQSKNVPKTEKELAEQLGITQQTIQNYKKLSEMIPELEELVDTGITTITTALAIMKTLSEEEQREFINLLPTDKKYTQRQMDEEIQKYKNRISELIQQGTKTEIVTQEVDRPETLNKIKDLEEKLNKKTQENEKMSSTLIEKEKMINEAIGSSTNYQLTSHCSEITLKMLNFVKDMAKYDYMAESFNQIPIATRIEYEKCIKAVKKWADRILETIEEEKNIIEM